MTNTPTTPSTANIELMECALVDMLAAHLVCDNYATFQYIEKHGGTTSETDLLDCGQYFEHMMAALGVYRHSFRITAALQAPVNQFTNTDEGSPISHYADLRHEKIPAEMPLPKDLTRDRAQRVLFDLDIIHDRVSKNFIKGETGDEEKATMANSGFVIALAWVKGAIQSLRTAVNANTPYSIKTPSHKKRPTRPAAPFDATDAPGTNTLQ